jgi:hypothetical protein
MSEVDGINMVEEQDHPTNHQLGEEDMNMVSSHMVEVADSSGARGGCKIGVFKRSYRVYTSGLQLFDMA